MTTIINQLYSADDLKLVNLHQVTNNLITDPNIHKNKPANIILNKGGINIATTATMGYLTSEMQRRTKFTFNTYNARAEDMTDSTLWLQAFCETHCLIPVSGFYGFVDNHPQAIPYMYSPQEDAVTYLAGYYNYNKKSDSYSFAIITCETNYQTKDTPNRLPLMVKGDSARDWLMREVNDNLIPDYCDYKLNQQRVCRRIKNGNIKNLDSLYHLG